MKLLQVTFKNQDGKEVYTTQVELNPEDNDSINKLNKLEYISATANQQEVATGVSAVAMALFNNLTDSVSQYLGMSSIKRADYNVTVQFPFDTPKSTERSIWLSSYVENEKGARMLSLYLDIIINDSKKKLSWYTIYHLLRLGNLFTNYYRISRNIVCDEEWKDAALWVMIFMDTENFDTALPHVDELIRLSSNKLNEDNWNSLVSTFAMLSTDASLTDNSRSFSRKVWYRLGEKRLLPWHSVTEEFLSLMDKAADKSKEKNSDKMGNISRNEENSYIFDKYANWNVMVGPISLGPTNIAFDKVFLEVFSRRFKSEYILKEFLEDLPWKENIFLAGGCVVDTIRESISANCDRLSNSFESTITGDMDFFILGSDENKKKQTLASLLEKVQKYFGNRGLYYGLHGGVLTIWFTAGFPDSFSIQVIMSSCLNPNRLLEEFDLSCCEVLWNGETIFSTQRFVDALVKGEGFSKAATLKRILKYNNKGWIVTTNKNEISRLLYNRYMKAPEKEIKDLLNEIRYNQVVLPRCPEAAMYQLVKRFPELTKDCIAHTVFCNNLSVKETIRGICGMIKGSTIFDAFYRCKDQDADILTDKVETSKQINVGTFGALTWQEVNMKDYALRMWFPRMDQKKISFRIDGLGVKCNNVPEGKAGNFVIFKSCREKPKYRGHEDSLPPESEFRIRCDSLTTATFMNMVNELFNNFLGYCKEKNLGSQKKTRGIAELQELKKSYNDMIFKRTSWPKKLLETGYLSFKESKWEIAELFFKGVGLKKERLGFVGEKFDISSPESLKTRLPNANISDMPIFESLENLNVSVDLTLKVVLMSNEEFIPSLTVNSITLYEIEKPFKT